MSSKSLALGLAYVLVALGSGGTAQAQKYLLTAGSGGQLQVGTGLPLPIGTAGIFSGGMTPVNGGTSCGAGPGGCSISPDGPGSTYWPPLLVPPNPNISTGGAATRVIDATTAGPGTGLIIPPAALSLPAPGSGRTIAVYPTNPAVYQVRTTISFNWPAVTATLAPGGGPGVPGGVTPVPFGGPGPGMIVYTGGVKAFGGAAQFVIAPGPGAAGGRIPPNTLGKAPVATVWLNAPTPMSPASQTAVALVGHSAGPGLAGPGAPTTAAPVTTMFGPVASGFGRVNVTSGTPDLPPSNRSS